MCKWFLQEVDVPFPPPQKKKKTNMTMENPPVEDVLLYFLLKIGIFQCHASFQGCIHTVDGRNPAPSGTRNFGNDGINYQPQLVQDFFPQQ